MGRKNKRDLLLDTAETLFARNGYGATGINQITETADVATMTLYNNFSNKDELITEMLIRRAERFTLAIEEKIAQAPDAPRQQILAIFDLFQSWYRAELKSSNGFTGCLFTRAALEFQSTHHPAHEVAVWQRKQLLSVFSRLLKEARYQNHKEIALNLHILIDGAITQAQLLKNMNSFKRAKTMAQLLITHD